MVMISDDKVREIRSRATILDVVSDYVRLKKSGANYLGLCPFHHEKTPSFNVNPSKDIFHCFGCGVGGDVFAFLMKIEGLSFPEAVKFLAKRVGITIEDRPPSPEERRKSEEKESYHQVIERVARFYSTILLEQKDGEPGRRYIAGRGVDLETAASCRLGFAPDRWDGLTRYLEKLKISPEVAENLGLVRKREGGGYYDTFRNRLLFTIADPQGRCIAFGGRVLDDSLPKYLNSPESPIYHKSEVLYGLDLAKQSVREKGCVYIVEGYFDHLALYKAGIKNVVATCGTALTGAQVKLLKRSADRVFSLFDADAAGKKATFRAMDLFLESNFPAHVVTLPEGEDPDSFVGNKGLESFLERVANSEPIFDFFVRDLCRNNDIGKVEGKVKVLDELAARIEKMANPLEQDLYVREVSRLIGIEADTLLRRIRHGDKPHRGNPAASAKEKTKGGICAEEMLLTLMGKYPEVVEKVKEFGVRRLFGEDLVPVAETILSQISMHNVIEWPKVLEQISSPEERQRIASLLVDDRHLEDIDVQKAFEQCCMALERTTLRELKALARELAITEPGSDRYMELLEKIETLRNRKSRLT